MMRSTLCYSPKMDQLTPEEEELLAKDLKLIKKAVEVSHRLNSKKLTTRNAHATSLGFVRGYFVATGNQFPEFTELLEGADLGVILRFSLPNNQMDRSNKEFPMYGCALKIYNKNLPLSVKFPLVNFPLFVTNSVSKFLKLHCKANQYLISKGKLFSPSFLKIPGLLFSGLRLIWDTEFFSIIRNILKISKIKRKFIVGCDFHSIGCYRLGNKIIKIRVRPSNRERFTEVSEINQPESLKEYFLENELNLDFQVQLGLNEKKTPVNNLLKMWKERDSPYVTIGKIHLPKQDITKYSNIEYENLSFDPFENKAGLRPVGRIMKIRQETYRVSIATRQLLNNNSLK